MSDIKGNLKVVELFNEEPNKKIIEALELATKMAKAGELRSLALIGLTYDDSVVCSAISDKQYSTLAGELDLLKISIQRGVLYSREVD